jgi:thymidine kinase
MIKTSRKSGHLAMYMGPMYSGKTSKLLELYKQFSFCNIATSVVNYAEDARYTTESMVSTHDKQMIPCVLSMSLFESFPIESETFNKFSVYLINEGQFFNDIVEWTKIAIGHPHNKRVYICGLDGDFKRSVFGNWLDLIAYSDTVQKLTSICLDCRDESAIFSHRMTSETHQKVIGSESYIPLCRACYEERCGNP